MEFVRDVVIVKSSLNTRLLKPAATAAAGGEAGTQSPPLEDSASTSQLAVVPPLLPVQLQVHGPVPATAVAVPVAQRLVVGATFDVVPLADPQVPFTLAIFAKQAPTSPPAAPTQFQIHASPSTVTVVAVPTLQRSVVGMLVRVWPLDDPQTPLTGISEAVH